MEPRWRRVDFSFGGVLDLLNMVLTLETTFYEVKKRRFVTNDNSQLILTRRIPTLLRG